MQIYKAEAEIADLVAYDNSVSYTSVVREADLSDDRKAFLREMVMKSQADANPEQFDLLYLESVLVSTGWNANDDVFDRSEIWTAKNSPVDKQVNFMHNEADIIGHITSSMVVDFGGNVISDDTPFDDVPSDFDIVVGSVLYKYWSDPELQSRMNKIVSGLSDNQWFVSMECLFKNFDYAIVTPNGDNKVIARSEDSAFLTKHLRVYGGTGEFDGHKIGRLLRNLGFSGKGIVDNPANKRSDILNFNNKQEVHTFAGAIASVEVLSNENSQENTRMANDNTVSQEQFDAIKAELDQLKAAREKVVSEKIDSLEKQVSELTETIAKLTSELEAGKEVLAAKDEKITAVEQELEDSKKNLAEANEKIDSINLEAAKASRLGKLLQAGVEEEKATTLVNKFVDASDEMFDALLESLPAKKEEESKTEDAEAEEHMDKKKKKKEEDAKAEDVNADNLDEAEEEESNADLNVDDTELETVAAKAAAWFQNSVLQSTAGKDADNS